MIRKQSEILMTLV